MKKAFLILNLSLSVLLLAAGATAQNRLIKTRPMGTVTRDELVRSYGPLVQYSITTYKVWYLTTGIDGKPDTATGLVVFPVVENKALPLLCYQHGTVNGPNDVPSVRQGGWELAGVGAALGYVALAPDYLGLGESRGFHPYVHAATEASAAIDLIYATKEFAENLKFPLNGQLFLTGYSQGGHASMALHRELERNYSQTLPVTAAAHLSGPYSISGETFKRLISNEPYNYVGYTVWVALSYNQMYGIHDNVEKLLKQPYADMAMKFYRHEVGLFDLNKMLIDTLTKRHGKPISRLMFQDSLLENVSKNPNHPFLRAMRDNDVYDWAPKAPTRIFYCKADDQVTYRNSVLADSIMQLRGAKDVKSADVRSNADHGQCVEPAVLQTVFFFAGVQAQIATGTRDLPTLAVRMYPNPAREFARLEGLPESGQVILSNLQGQVVFRSNIGDSYMDIPLKGLSKGMYSVQLLSSKGVWYNKLLVQ
ncbi:MAG: T9SS type A sorting domain-containing protein [Haliscomenobacter sp.]|uniref:T9SS type A sorting domain-containing protein n=1 Tax=Haliscomenobacter sp. TaxID=2717303 RepID=UPI0029A6FF8A|nr:T9SS type A sorting domain-containing protein [Haliscomenobacter sp.]MDX2066894.1 T9SS type A sorting domain-containing protein [Haliscomenobacter sp.]